MAEPTDPLLTPAQVEEKAGISTRTLSNMRWQNRGPDYIKLSPGRGGRIRYRASAVDAWLDERTTRTGDH